MAYRITTEWDEEARVWTAMSDDVPGLCTEADTVEALVAKLRVIVPELLELNGARSASVQDASMELVVRVPLSADGLECSERPDQRAFAVEELIEADAAEIAKASVPAEHAYLDALHKG